MRKTGKFRPTPDSGFSELDPATLGLGGGQHAAYFTSLQSPYGPPQSADFLPGCGF